MSRYEQRRAERLKNPEIAAGYQEMDSELQLIAALDQLRVNADLSMEELAHRMGKQRASISRLFNAERPNPTLDTLTDLLAALGVTAEIRLRPAQKGEFPIKIEVSG